MAKEAPVFTDGEGGFEFAPHVWNNMWAADRLRYMPDARAHRDEAIRRKAVCRLDGRAREAEHWLAAQRFFENKFKLEPIE